MKRRKLGSHGLVVSAMGLGCMGMSEFYGSADQSEAVATLHRALDLGVNFLDTADVYGLGRNEELVGRAIKGRRHQVILATKFGIVRDAEGRFLEVNGRPEYVGQACEAERSVALLLLDRHDAGVSAGAGISASARSHLVTGGKPEK